MTDNNFKLTKIAELNISDAKKYIDNFIIPLDDGTHAIHNNNVYKVIKDDVLKRTYFKRMSSELHKYYFSEKKDIRTITYDVNKPVLYDDKLNLCPKIIQTYKKFSECSSKAQKQAHIMLDHIKTVWCSSNLESYNFTLKWLSNMIRGNRNDSCIYLKGPQGVGKSTPLEFIRAHVIGKLLSYQGGSNPIKSKFNSELSGKLMIMFEELENFNVSEWRSISSVLKRQITSPTLMIELKGCDAREEKNLNNYFILSNNNCITDDDGRRYFILDISTHRKIKTKENIEYWQNLYDCFNDECGQAFYSYLMTINLDKYNAQSYPLTNSKLDSYGQRLGSVEKFIKDEYVLNRKGISKITVATMHENYKMYCSDNNLKSVTKIEYNKILKDLGINYFASSSKNYYRVECEVLKSIAEGNHWLHNLDEYACEEKQQTQPEQKKQQVKPTIALKTMDDYDDEELFDYEQPKLNNETQDDDEDYDEKIKQKLKENKKKDITKPKELNKKPKHAKKRDISNAINQLNKFPDF